MRCNCQTKKSPDDSKGMSGQQASLTAPLHYRFLTGLWEGRWLFPMDVRQQWRCGIASKGEGEWPDAEHKRKIMPLSTACSHVKFFSKQLVNEIPKDPISPPPVPYLSCLPPSYLLPKGEQAYLSGILLTRQGLNSSWGS